MKPALVPLLAGLLLQSWLLSRPVQDAPLQAGTSVPVEWTGLAERCEHALEGRVQSVRVQRVAGAPETEVTLRILRRHHGTGPTLQVIRVPGGQLADGSGLLVPGLPRFVEGEELLLFLSPESTRGWRVPVGLDQGYWKLTRDAAGRRMLERPGSQRIREDYEAAMLQVTQALAARRARESGR
jgi:hypothetical protein